MEISGGQNLGHLTYCTNIHAGETWADILAGMRRHLPDVKQQVSPNAPLGIGLRLSAAAAETLSDPQVMIEFQQFLIDGDYYIFTLNGFPYGNFHGSRVKEGAYKPDWTQTSRLEYTNTLADHLAIWLPEGMEGSVSTVPGTFKPWAQGPDGAQVVAKIVDNLIRHVAHLVKLHARTGKLINLALEPEPFCLIETIEETVRFFEDQLYSTAAANQLSQLTGLARPATATALRDHLGCCYDVCHAAVEFEDPKASLNALRDAGIKISKLQLSSAVRIPKVDANTAALLKPLDEPVYMHQVIQNRNGALLRHADVPIALETIEQAYGAEWRIHFHVPIFLKEMEHLATTQQFLKDVLAIHAKSPVTQQLEVETYTWDVLPANQRTDGLSAAIARELKWVQHQLTGAKT